MSKRARIDLFVEDRAHEAIVGALVRRVARNAQIVVAIQTRSARGGHPRAIKEFRLYQQVVKEHQRIPDLLVVGIDGNCSTFAKKRTEIAGETQEWLKDRLITACPDPHVERWLLADLQSFAKVVGARPTVGRKKCVRDHYKHLLANAVRAAGHPPTLGGVEFASELVDAMDLYRAGKTDPSLSAFLSDLRGKLRTVQKP